MQTKDNFKQIQTSNLHVEHSNPSKYLPKYTNQGLFTNKKLYIQINVQSQYTNKSENEKFNDPK